MEILRLGNFIEQKEIRWIISLIFGILVFATILFWIWGRLRPNTNLSELKMRTKSWWLMAGIFVAVTLVNPLISYCAIALLSFTALRELVSISKNIREADRRILLWCYLAVPVQYYFAYNGYYSLFLIFIPIAMHLWIPFMLVIKGITEDIGRSMSVLPSQLMLTVFAISHLAFLLSLPDLPGYELGGRGLLLFVVFITEMNDVFQFTWGKLFGHFKILPTISPIKPGKDLLEGLSPLL